MSPAEWLVLYVGVGCIAAGWFILLCESAPVMAWTATDGDVDEVRRTVTAPRAAWNRWYARNKATERARRQERRAVTRQYVENYKVKYGCSRCDEKHPACLDFHHRDPATKSFNISIHGRKTLRVVKQEILKCDLLCANCHRKLHWTE